MKQLHFFLSTLIFCLCCTAESLTAQIQNSAVAGSFSPELDKQLTTALKSGDKEAIGDAILEICFEQTRASLFFDAIDNAQKAAAIFEALNKPKKVALTYTPMMWAHYSLHNLDKMELYAQKMLDIGRQEKDSVSISRSLSSLAILYGERKEYDKALSVCLESYKIAEASEIARKNNLTGAGINLAQAYFNLGKYEESRHYARLMADRAKAEKDTLLFATAKCNETVALAYLKQFEAAEVALKEAEVVVKAINSPHFDRDLYYASAIVYGQKGNYEQAYKAHKTFYTLDSTLTSATNFERLSQIETAFQTKKKEQENERLSAQVKMQWLGFGAAALALLSLVGFFYFQRNRLKINNKLLETQQELANEKLQNAEKELADFTQSLREKTEAFDKLKGEVEIQNASAESEKWLSQIHEAVLLTDEQWRSFRQKFERVHPQFFNQLVEFIPDATEAEKRFSALSKLNLSGQEIAAMLGVSPESVVKTRYRLKKKLEGGDLESLFARL